MRKLFPHQRAGVAFLATAKRALLEDQQGVGKSATSISTLKALYLLGENPFPALIIAPNSVKLNWKRECEMWWPGLQVNVVQGSAAARRKLLTDPAHVYVMNWESLRTHSRLAPYGGTSLKRCKECGGEDERITWNRCEVHKRELNMLDFQSVIADECFLGHVLIDTPDGERPIAALKPGDSVYGYDHETNSVIVSQILDTMTRKSGAVVPGWDATPNHPFYVADQGYRALGDLNASDELIELSGSTTRRVNANEAAHRVGAIHVSNLSRSVREDAVSCPAGRKPWASDQVLFSDVPYAGQVAHDNVQALQREVSHDTAQRATEAKLLQQVMCDEYSTRVAAAAGARSAPYAGDASRSRSRRETVGVPLERPQSVQEYVLGGAVSALEAELAEVGSWASETREAVTRAAGTSIASSRGGYGQVHSDDRRRDTKVLLSGSSVLSADASSRSGRWSSSVPGTTRVRPASDGSSRADGMVRHALLELRDHARYRSVCAESARSTRGTVPVYSLTTSTGNYFANGVLVRNCHRMKDPKAKQTRALWAATGDAPFRIGLTGTPIANAVDELWSILHWLDPDEWPTRSKYIDRYCLTVTNVFGAPTVIGLKPENRDEFFKIADPRLRRMPKELVLPFLPPVVRERRDVEMKPKQARAYKQMAERLIAELEDGDVVTATSPLTKATRLMQFASSFATLEERPVRKPNGDMGTETIVRLTEPSSKIDAFMQDLPDFGDDSIVVFAVSRQLIEMLSKKLDEKGLAHGLITGSQTPDQRQAHIDDFQNGKTKLILCTIQAGGVGLTLTAGRIAVFLQRSWSAVDNSQAEARIHRIGAEVHESILYVDYVTADTLEEDQLDAINTKYIRLEEIVRDKETLLAHLKKDEAKGTEVDDDISGAEDFDPTESPDE